MISVREAFDSEGIGVYNNLQILDFTSKVEWFVQGEDVIPYHLGKNLTFLSNKIKPTPPSVTRTIPGTFFYWYTFPTMNYYHCINDGVGPLYNYFLLKDRIPDIKFILNARPRKVEKHPPFVTELLDLLDISYEFSDQTAQYERVYFSDTLCNERGTGKRKPPDNRIYSMIERLVRISRKIYPDVPVHDSVYLSRRTHANPQYNTHIIGEDNTVKRGLVNEDLIVNILKDIGFTEVFGENYNLGEKISMFSKMQKYISTAGAGVTNCLWRINEPLSVGGIHTPGFPFPSEDHNRHIVAQNPWMQKCRIRLYPGEVRFEDPQPVKGYNHPWLIANTQEFYNWAKTI